MKISKNEGNFGNMRDLLVNFPKINKQGATGKVKCDAYQLFYAYWIRRWECSINRLWRGKRSNYLFANEDYFIANTLMRVASTFILLLIFVYSKAHTIKALFLICHIVPKCGIQPPNGDQLTFKYLYSPI